MKSIMKLHVPCLAVLVLILSIGLSDINAQSIPTDNLRLHLKADAGVTTTIGGDAVTAWADQSGNGLSNTTPINLNARPTLVPNIINGNPVIRFSGSQALNLPAASEIGITNSDYEIFIVYRSTSVFNEGLVGIQFILAGADEQFELHTNGGNGLRFIPNNLGAAPAPRYVDVGAVGAYTDTDPYIIRLQATDTYGEVSVNGIDLQRNTDLTNGYRSSHTGPIRLGMRSSNVFPLQGDIAEVIVYNQILSEANREAVEEYLNDKYLNINPPTPPTTQVGSITFSEVRSSRVQLNLTPGDGNGRIIFAKKQFEVDYDPQNGVAYNANNFFPNAPVFGDGNRVVYKGSGTTVTVTGLEPDEEYHFYAAEYNGVPGQEIYLLDDPALNSVTTNSIPIVDENIPLENLRLHLRADIGVTTSNGELVTAWEDQSGNELSDTEPLNENVRPSLVSDMINGQPVIRFSGGQVLNLPSASEIGINGSDYEIFIIYRSTSSHNNVEFIMGGTETLNFELHTNGGNGLRFIPNSSAGNFIDVGTDGAFTDEEPHHIRLQATDNTGEIEVNRTDQTGNSMNARSNHAGGILLGQRGGGDFDLHGDIAEIIIYNSTLSTEDREAVEEYLLDKYVPVFAGGNGTELSPYQIATPAQLDAVRNHLSAYFVLNNNINLATYLSEGNPGYNDGEGWEPIGTNTDRFTGTFNGNGMTISNLFIDRTDFYSSLFGRVENAEFRNLKLQAVEIRGVNDYKGGLAGYIGSSLIDNVHVTGSVEGGSQIGGLIGYSTNSTIQESSSTVTVTNICSGGTCTDAGGLVGRADDGTIRLSYATGDVTGNNNVGGLVGLISAGAVIEDSYATGSVSATTGDGPGTNEKAGGLVGNNFSSTITRSYASGSVAGASETGGLAGANSGTITNSYWNTDSSGLETSAGGTGLDDEEMQESASFEEWDFETIWDIFEDFSYPYLRNNTPDDLPGFTDPFAGGDGSPGTPFQIEMPFQLDFIRDYLSSSFILNNNIDLTVYLSEGNPGYNGAQGWAAIGTDDNPFTGTFNGNKKKISNLFIESDSDYLGLFGKLDGDVYDLELNNVSISNRGVNNQHVGSLAGYLDGGKISKITVSGTISASNDGGLSGVGGLIGTGKNATIENSTVDVDVSVDDINGFNMSARFGGVIGYSETHLTINDVISTGNITVPSDGALQISGGFAGHIASTENIILNSTASGNVSGGGDRLGGFIGEATNLEIENSSASGNVEVRYNGNSFGGFIGRLTSGDISFSYATGSISKLNGLSTENTGGFIGSANSTTIDQSYATGEVSGESAVGGFIGNAFGLTINQAYATGEVSGESAVGGFIGNGSGLTINQAYATGAASGNLSGIYVGGFFGGSSGSYGNTFTNSYWNTETSGMATSTAGTPKTTAELNQKTTFTDWDFEETWQIIEGATLPWLRNVSGNHRNAAPTLDGSQGWRLLANPISDVSYATFFSNIWTQGITGAATGSGTPNIFLWDNTSTGSGSENWQSLSNMSNTLESGAGVLIYVYSDDDPSDEELGNEFPKTLFFSGYESDGDQVMTLNDAVDGWTLVGNPFTTAIDWDEFTNRSDLSNSVYVWDGEGQQWLTWNGTVGGLTDGEIPPYHSFFVQTTGESPSLTIPESAKVEESQQKIAAKGKGKAKQESIYMSLSLNHENGQSSKAWFQFSEQGSLGLDSYDAMKLTPLSDSYVMLASKLEEDILLDINHLPIAAEYVELPLHLFATEEGQLSISLSDMNLPDDWAVSIKNNATGQEFELIEPYTLEYEEGMDNELSLLVTTGAIDDGGSMLPESFGLSQNYPNPFNPVTIIGYQLPESSDVRLELFDMLGRRVATLINDQVEAGRHEVTFNASNLASGIYIYRLRAGNEVFTKKLTLIK